MTIDFEDYSNEYNIPNVELGNKIIDVMIEYRQHPRQNIDTNDPIVEKLLELASFVKLNNYILAEESLRYVSATLPDRLYEIIMRRYMAYKVRMSLNVYQTIINDKIEQGALTIDCTLFKGCKEQLDYLIDTLESGWLHKAHNIIKTVLSPTSLLLVPPEVYFYILTKTVDEADQCRFLIFMGQDNPEYKKFVGKSSAEGFRIAEYSRISDQKVYY